MAVARADLERELAVLRLRAADAAAEGREDPATALQLQELQASLCALEVPAGSLPASGSGVWSPLPLHESAGVTAKPERPPLTQPAPKPRAAASTEVRALSYLGGEVNDTLRAVLSGAWRNWNKSRAWRLGVLHRLAEEHPDGAVNCIANGALRVVTGEAMAAPRIGLWDPPPRGLQTSTQTPDAVTGLTPSSRRLLEVLAGRSTPENPVPIVDLLSELPDPAHAGEELSAFVHPARAYPLAVRLGDRVHATVAALELLRGECVLPLLLINGFEGAVTHVPPHPISETIDAVLQRLELPGMTFAPNLVPDPRAAGHISRETVGAYLLSGTGALHWRARVNFRADGEVWVSELGWALGPEQLAERIEYVRRALGRLVGVTSVETGRSELRVRVEHEHFTLGVWWELLSSGIVERVWTVDLHVRHRDEARRVTGLELIDAFIDQRLASLSARPEPAPLQLAWERAHAQEGLCVALRTLDHVQSALSHPDALQTLTAFQAPVAVAARDLPLRASSDYARGFTEIQARHLVALSDLSSRRVSEEDALWLALRAELDRARAHPVSSLPRARLRRELLELRARLDVPRQTQIVETLR